MNAQYRKMVIVVILLNLLISLCCFYIAWRVWVLRQILAAAAKAVNAADRSTDQVLQNAPQGIYQGQLGVSGLRIRYRQLDIQWQRVEKVLAVLGSLQKIWQLARCYRPRHSPSKRSQPSLYYGKGRRETS